MLAVENASLKQQIALLTDSQFTSGDQADVFKDLLKLQRQRIDKVEKSYSSLYQRYERLVASNKVLEKQISVLETDLAVAHETFKGELKLYEQYRARSENQEQEIYGIASKHSKTLVKVQQKLARYKAELEQCKTQMTTVKILSSQNKPQINLPSYRSITPGLAYMDSSTMSKRVHKVNLGLIKTTAVSSERT